MEIHHLIKMANQIGDYFAAYPDKEDAARQTAKHLKDFWEPRMRREIIAYLQETGAPELNEIPRQAVRLLAESAEKQPST